MKTEKNIFIAFILNLFFSIFEILGGIFTNSVAILSDAVHDFGDAISIGISYFLEKKSKRKPDSNYTFGYMRYSILGAFITVMILILGSSFVAVEAIKRILNPTIVKYNHMIIFAILGVIINFIAAYFTKEGKSINQRTVNLHMIEDILGWLVVLIGSVLMKHTNIMLIDSVMSIGIALFVIVHAIKNLKIILDLFLAKVPNNISIKEVKNHLTKIKDIKDVHHIHLWSMDEFNIYLTMHVVTNTKDQVLLKNNIRNEMKKIGINHVTIEIEKEDENCECMECIVENGNCHIGHTHHHS